MKFNTFQSLATSLLDSVHFCSRNIRFQSLWVSATRSIHVYLLSSCYFAFIWFQFKSWNCIRHTAHTRIHIYILTVHLKNNNTHHIIILCRCICNRVVRETKRFIPDIWFHVMTEKEKKLAFSHVWKWNFSHFYL